MNLNFGSIVALISILGGLGYIFDYLDKTVRDDVRKDLVQWMNRTSSMTISEIVSSSNHFFLKIFDHIYSSKMYNFSIYLWLLILGIFISSLAISQLYSVLNFDFMDIHFVLILGFLLGSSNFFLFLSLSKKIKAKNIIIISYFLLYLIFWFLFLTLSWLPKWWNWNVVSYQVIIIMIFGIFSIIPFYIAHNFMIRKDFILSPIKAILTSIFFILCISLFKWDVAILFFRDIKLIGWSLISYLLLNFCVDSFSLLETKFAIKFTLKGSLFKFFIVILLDIIASGLLFLAIPIASRSFNVFVEGIFFNGSKPWIGILFWSSFSTSIFFYLYLTSTLTLLISQHILKSMVFLNRFLPVSEKPFRCIGLMSMAITFLIVIFLFIISYL